MSDEPTATYVAGPMTGYPDWNTPAFEEMAKRLRAAGLEVIAPNELHAPDENIAHSWYLRRDIAKMVECCGRVVFLTGWERSKGARMEHFVAEQLDMELIYPYEHTEFFAKLCPNHDGECHLCARGEL